MAKSTRLFKSFIRLLSPILLLVITAIVGGAVFLVYKTAHPIPSPYLVTPNKYGQLSSRAAQVTDETWQNHDGSTARGWLLRGAENAPAVILLHKYDTDRSYMLNLGVKLNESTNFTVLMPDQRGHGENPLVQNASFGGCESEDAGAAVEFLHNLKTPDQIALVGKSIGIFGVEMGAIIAIAAAAKDPSVKAIAVDSAAQNSDGILREAIGRRFPFGRIATEKLARLGTYLYYYDGCYQHEPICDTARKVENRNVLVLAGIDSQDLEESNAKLSKCFAPSSRIETKTDLSPSGLGIINASMEQSEAYDQRIIDFFRISLGG